MKYWATFLLLMVLIGGCNEDDLFPPIIAVFGDEFTLGINQQAIVGDSDSDNKVSVTLRNITDNRCPNPPGSSPCTQSPIVIAEAEIIIIGHLQNIKICMGGVPLAV